MSFSHYHRSLTPTSIHDSHYNKSFPLKVSDFICSPICNKKIGNIYVLSSSPYIHISLGPHWIGTVVTLILIAGGTLLDYNIVAQNTAISSSFQSFCIHYIYIMCTTTMTLLLLTACSDPGITTKENQLFDTSLIGSSNSSSKYDEVFDSEGDSCFHCDECDIKQPQRMNIYHCYDCGCCIIGHDHHCPWMSKCIGKKNMKWFILFNISWMLYLLQLLLFAMYF